jgi:hypothetical protein
MHRATVSHTQARNNIFKVVPETRFRLFLGGISLASRIIQAEMAPLLRVMIDTEGPLI